MNSGHQRPGSPLRILIADDNPDVTLTLGTLNSGAGVVDSVREFQPEPRELLQILDDTQRRRAEAA